MDTKKYPGNRLSPRASLRRALTLGSATLAAAVALPAQAQTTKPLRILVGFPAGGSIDVIARSIAETIKDEFGGSVVIENRPGAGGQLAAQALKAAAPDGRTLLLSPDHTAVVLPHTVRNPGFDSVTDLLPVCPVATYLGGLAVSANTGITTFKDFLAWVKEDPKRGNVGVPAPGGVAHFALQRLGQQAGVPLQSVPFRGSAPLVQDLAAGQIAAGTTAMGDFLEYHKLGRLRVVAVSDRQRSALLPDVPTFPELGYDWDWRFWLGLFAPAGTPQGTVAAINAAVNKAVVTPAVRERMTGFVFDPAPGPADQLAGWVRDGLAYWKPIVAASGWTPQ